MPDAIEKAPCGVNWRDLTPMRGHEILRELALPLPWLALSLCLYATPFWLLGFPASFMFFLCALRLNHEVIHSNLGLSRRWDNVVMHVLSGIMGASNHAVAHGHMIHHKHAMGPGDFEGKCGHMSFWQVLCYGPRFPLDINREAWNSGRRELRKRLVIDWTLNLALVGLALGSGAAFLMLHVVAMGIAQCLTALFAVWITHQGTATSGLAGRSQRGPMARFAYLMFYHREHHLFPKVPVRRLPELAAHLDAKVPGYAKERRPVVPWFDKAGAIE